MWTSPALAPWPHGFTGVAHGDLRPGAAGAEESGRALLRALGGARLITVRQVHGARVVDAARAGPTVEADGVVSTDPALLVAVRVADCVPVLLAAPGGVAAVHAGWRGTAQDIVRVALTALRARTGAAPEAVRAAIGPAIGGECYEVGEEVVEAVRRVAPGTDWLGPGRRVDLRRANAAILTAEGVRVDLVGPCTRCHAGLWSHRRDGPAAGRQAGLIRC